MAVSSNAGLKIRGHSMGRSTPWASPAAAATFQQIGLDFAQAVDGTAAAGARLVATSMTRTEAQQAAVRLSSRAATAGPSAHSYGAAMDVGHMEVPRGSCALAQAAMAEVLTRHQEDGRVLLVPESGCIHVTAVGEPSVGP
jgi:uncharacterized protein YcbK (DUF882 family)